MNDEEYTVTKDDIITILVNNKPLYEVKNPEIMLFENSCTDIVPVKLPDGKIAELHVITDETETNIYLSGILSKKYY